MVNTGKRWPSLSRKDREKKGREKGTNKGEFKEEIGRVR